MTFALGPHAIYTCGEDYLRYVAEIAKEKGLMINIHMSETQFEFDTCMKEHGMTPLAYLQEPRPAGRAGILAHCVYLAEEDYAISDETGRVRRDQSGQQHEARERLCPGAPHGPEGHQRLPGDGRRRQQQRPEYVPGNAPADPEPEGRGRRTRSSLKADETLQIAVENGYKAMGLDGRPTRGGGDRQNGQRI